MAHRDRDAGVDEAPDRIEGAGALGGECDLADRAASRLEQAVDGCRVRRPQQRLGVRALVAGVEERALEVRAEDGGIGVAEVGDHRHPRGEVVDRRGDEREHRARRAVGAVHGTRGRHGLRAVVEARAGAAVPMDVDEAGDEASVAAVHDLVGGREIAADAGRRDAAALEQRPPVRRDPVGHRVTTAE